MHMLHSLKSISYEGMRTSLMAWVTFPKWAWVTLLLACEFLLYGMDLLFLLYICVSFLLPSLLCIVKEKYELEIELEKVEEDCERRTWRVRAKLSEPRLIQCFSVSVLIQLKGRLIQCVHLLLLPVIFMLQLVQILVNLHFWSLIILYIFAEQLIFNRRRIWLGFPIVGFALVIDLTSSCLIELLAVFHCANGLVYIVYVLSIIT